MHPLKKAYYVARYLGPTFVWQRVSIAIEKRLGVARRTYASRPWGTIRLEEICAPGTPTSPAQYAAFKREQRPPFVFPLGEPPVLPEWLAQAARAGERTPALAERVRLLSEDRCVLFFRRPSPAPIDWYTNPLTGHRSQPGRCWVDVPDYLPEQGDPRTLWEPARCAWAIDLARARAHGVDADAAALYWRWLDSFMSACPPFEGVQWKCGQEASVRLIALALGFAAVAADPATTPQRWEQFARLAWATGYRVAHHITYAISQRNNHAMSEATGLLLVGTLFPEFRESEAWRATGRRVLTREIRRQTYADGSYIQQSMNYQRVMLAGSLFGLRLAELRGEPLPRDVYERLGRCGEFLWQLSDPETGRCPNYGNNDGAHVLPLSECDFTDFRPIIQATHYLVHRERRLPPGPWDEDLVWLFGVDALDAKARSSESPCSQAFRVGGYYTLRQRESWAFIRAHEYRTRQGQCDTLHVDLWWRGQNICVDAGTYQYYVPGRPDMERYFKSSESHNTVELDGGPPLELVSRFLWFPWSRARCERYETREGLVLEAVSHDYDRGPWRVLHRRSVTTLWEDAFVVVDDLVGAGRHQAVLRWHFIDVPLKHDAARGTVSLATPKGEFGVTVASRATHTRFDVVRGRDEPGRVQGFWSPYYGELLPAPTLEAAFVEPLPLRIISVLAPGAPAVARLAESPQGLEAWEFVRGSDVATLTLPAPARDLERILAGAATRAPSLPARG